MAIRKSFLLALVLPELFYWLKYDHAYVLSQSEWDQLPAFFPALPFFRCSLIGFTFSRRFHLHVFLRSNSIHFFPRFPLITNFPRAPLVTYFPALSTCHIFFPRFPFVKPRPNDGKRSTQHIAILLSAASSVRLATMLRCVATCWVLLSEVWNGQIWPNDTQHAATCCNSVTKPTQHVAPNNVAICCVGTCMLRSFGRGYTGVPALSLWVKFSDWFVTLFSSQGSSF